MLTLTNSLIRQEKLAVDEYIEEFSMLQCVCELKSENYDFDCFLRGLRPGMLENMRDCKDIFERYQEAIGVEYRIRWSHTRKFKSQKEQSP